MSNEALYYEALQKFSDTDTNSSYVFQEICFILANYLYSKDKYNFQRPEGGHGTQDGGYGGYDGIDPIKCAKVACSLNKDTTTKINQEIKKSKKNGDLELFYFTNQVTSQDDKNPIIRQEGKIKIIIHGIDCLSNTLDKYFEEHFGDELYDLLGLSFLKNGARFNRGDAIRREIEYNGKIY
jgi:hypothetical protein